MSSFTKPTSQSFHVMADICAIYVLPFIMGAINAVVLTFYGLAWVHFIPAAWLDVISLAAGATIISLWVGERAYQMGRQTPHLRTTSAELKQYVLQFFRILSVSCFIAVASHIVLTFLTWPIMVHITDRWFRDIAIPALCGLLEAAILHHTARHTFLQIPLPQKPRTLERGHDLSSGEAVERKARDDDD